MDADESRRWWEARRWPEDHPARVRSREEHAGTSGYESLDAAGRARVDRALRRGVSLEDPDEAAVAVALARSGRPSC